MLSSPRMAGSSGCVVPMPGRSFAAFARTKTWGVSGTFESCITIAKDERRLIETVRRVDSDSLHYPTESDTDRPIVHSVEATRDGI